MAESITVTLPSSLQDFVRTQTSGDGKYDDTGDYIRDLIRRDYERAESLKWERLQSLLQPGLSAPEADFQPVDRAASQCINKHEKERRSALVILASPHC
ncbi:MAG: ribbon-helix-helix domain-containing protein [Rhodospirillaceae bacterium]